MGDAKRRAARRNAFFAANPLCIYCGAPATTFDHCPPRTFFQERQWPETYEFPACEACNAAARLDEQALAVLIRSKLIEIEGVSEHAEWRELVQGVRNNQPQLIAEWKATTLRETRHGLRKAFGVHGDRLRREGWGLANLGPLTKAMLLRFAIKIGKALYYKHNGHILDGVLYSYQLDAISLSRNSDYLDHALGFAPALPSIQRNAKSLFDQFIYRVNYSPEHGAMHAVVKLGDQFFFQLIAMNRQMDALLQAQFPDALPMVARHE